MKTFNTGKCELVFVPVPDDGRGFSLCFHSTRMVFKTSDISYPRTVGGDAFIDLDRDPKRIIGFTDELTESDCLVIMDSVAGFKFNDFNSDKGICYDWSLSSAKESFNSLLTANQITGRQIVLRKIEHK